jgi:hypothetical protein
MRKASDATAPGSEAREDYYERACAALAEARSGRRDAAEHPYVTFLRYTLLVVGDHRRAAVGPIPGRWLRRWEDWVRAAEDSGIFNDPEGRETLETFKNEWLQLAAL